MNNKKEIRKAAAKARRETAKVDKYVAKNYGMSASQKNQVADKIEYLFGPRICKFAVDAYFSETSESKGKHMRQNPSNTTAQSLDGLQDETEGWIYEIKACITYTYLFGYAMTLVVLLLTMGSFVCKIMGKSISIPYEHIGLILFAHFGLFFSRYSRKFEWYAISICLFILFYSDFIVIKSIFLGVPGLKNSFAPS